MITASALTQLLPTIAQYGERVTAQGEAIYLLSENASSEVASILGPAVILGQAVAKAHQAFFAWVMDHQTFATFSLWLQAEIANHANIWHELRAALGKISFVRRFPNLASLRRGVNVSLEEVLATSIHAGIALTDFWGVSLYGQASLERLMQTDLALTRDLDFDPLTEEAIVLAEVAPRVPDVTRTLDVMRTSHTTAYADLLIAEGLTVAVQGGDTLSTVAGRHLGDPDQWQVLAELNGLRSPYISESALDQLGAVVGQRVMSSATVIGQSTAVLTSVSGLYQDQRIRFSTGTQEQTLTVSALSPTINTVIFAEAFTEAFPTSSVVTVYNPTYDVRGRVLQPGQLLILPARAGTNTRTLIQRKATASPARQYGTDVMLRQGDFVTGDGDLMLVSGIDNLSQAIRHRFQVERGELAFHPAYGTGLKTYLAWKNQPFFTFLAEIEAQQTVLRDPRIVGVEQFSTFITGDTIAMEMVARTSDHEQFPVPRFLLDVRA